ncbi:metalloprotease-like protein [Kribbella flavida DSM 17836]|uniref:Metalloprotease-like protein n=1 Tax=Kribbella flavida (strain DSM 17836 / JCM 10339 / NBRC 14399) TaxID=479435 RepID=D2Q2W3_KRIFD|nr:neutral zinc metallopeptidase [Kribbella flavida]ADB30294.1 metalloprotease-like protein [Kribbella flavida DSM 17836]
MPDEPTPPTPDPATGPEISTPAVAPGPGHFLPGGDGQVGGAETPRPLRAKGQATGLGKAVPVGAGEPRPRVAAPLPTEPGQSGYGAPPPAPLPGAPSAPLTGSRQRGGSRPVGWSSSSARRTPQFAADPVPVKPPRQFSKPVIVAVAVLAVIALSGAGVAGYRMMDSYDTVANPLARPSVKQTDAPLPAPPQPTVTVTATPVPDAVRVKQNALYTVGKVPAVNCADPKIKPSSEAAALRYYRALLPCLNRAWEPLVRKAGYPFRAPKLVLYAKNQTSCTGESNLAFYCGEDETITMRGDQDAKLFRQAPESGRAAIMSTLSHEYAHHVQMLTNILISSRSREGWATTEPAKLEENRRMELQASCLGAAFLGANKAALGLTGRRLTAWEFQTKHSGDEYNPKKKRDHGSRKNQWLWAGVSFKTANPASCNTFVAPAAKVS